MLAEFLSLLDWTGGQIYRKKRGTISAHLAPLHERIGLSGDAWCDLVTKFAQTFKRAAGSVASLQNEAAKRGQGWLQAPRNPAGEHREQQLKFDGVF